MATIEEIYKQHFLPEGASTDKRNRHIGIFSEDNIYYQQMQVATKKQDIDALYELAVKEEARLKQLADERDYSEGIRDEQREYDSPIQRVARDRAAGINSDLLGGSAGSSGSSGSSGAISNSVPTSQPAQGLTKFSNKYDNINAGVNIVNAVSNFASSLVGGFSNTVSSIAQLRKLPAELAINEVQADIAQATKQDVIDRSKRVNINDGLARIVQLSELFTDESTDEDITGFLGSIGYDADSIPSALNGIRQVQKNPLFKGKYENWKADMIAAEEYNNLYPSYVVSNMLWQEQQIRDFELDTEFVESNLRNAVAQILGNQDYAEALANEQVSSTQANTAENYSNVAKAKYDIKQFNAHVDAMEENIRNIDERISWCKEEIKRVSRLPKTPENDAYINTLYQSMGVLRTVGQYNVNVVNDVTSELGRKHYMRSMLTPDGQLLPEPRLTNKRKFVYSNIMFPQIESGEQDISSVVEPLKSVVKLFIP